MPTMLSLCPRAISRWFPWLLTLAVGAAMVLLPSAYVAAQDEPPGPPPSLPILFDGEVLVNGEPPTGPAELVARVGDWETNPVAVEEGAFRSLIVAPPDISYAGETVTFHLLVASAGGPSDLQASYTFEFPLLEEPRLESVTLEFQAQAEEPAPAPTPAEAAEPAGEAGTAPAAVVEEQGIDVPWLAILLAFASGGVAVVVLNLLLAWLRRRR